MALLVDLSVRVFLDVYSNGLCLTLSLLVALLVDVFLGLSMHLFAAQLVDYLVGLVLMGLSVSVREPVSDSVD